MTIELIQFDSHIKPRPRLESVIMVLDRVPIGTQAIIADPFEGMQCIVMVKYFQATGSKQF